MSAAGRTAVYIHSDRITSNKGACIAIVRCQTDFAAATPDFVRFADRIARLAYGFGVEFGPDQAEEGWEKLNRFYTSYGSSQTLQAEREALEGLLKEKVSVEQVVLRSLELESLDA